MSKFVRHPDRRPAIITGASSGIGRATALALGLSGFPVLLGARRVERLENVADEVRSAGGEAWAIGLDLSDPDSVESFVKKAREVADHIEVLVSAAGQSAPDSVDTPAPDQFAHVVGVNLLGAQRLVGLVLPDMIARNRGDVVFVTSEVVRVPRVRTLAYVASKWGLEGYARTLQMELEGTGVRVSIVQPGQTLSEMGSNWDADVTTSVLEEWIRWGAARHNHFLRPDAVANAVKVVVESPPGTSLSFVEVQPMAPVREDSKRPSDVTLDSTEGEQ